MFCWQSFDGVKAVKGREGSTWVRWKSPSFFQGASLNRWRVHGRSIPQINRNTACSLEVPAAGRVKFWHLDTAITPDFSLLDVFFSCRPSNLLLDQSNVDITTFHTTGDWLNGVRTAHCKEIFTGVEYSSCDTIAKISTE